VARKVTHLAVLLKPMS